jgi:hypothetical protein
MLCRRRVRDAVPLMTARRICYADDDCEEMCMLRRRRGRDAVPLMTKRKIRYADDAYDCEEMCYATQKARKRCCAAHD